MAQAHKGTLGRPSVQEANDFRRRMMAAGLITATLAVGVAGGAALGTSVSGIASSDATAISGQYDPANMGGTPLAPQRDASTGQYDPANMGGTPLAPQRDASLGQYDPANMGGTPQADHEE